MKILDTNILIRFLTNDDANLAEQAENILRTAAKSSLKLYDVVFVEIIFVLQSVYQLKKKTIVEIVSLLITFSAISCNKKLLGQTLWLFDEHSISIVDAYLLARAQLAPNSQIETFDLKLKRLTQR